MDVWEYFWDDFLKTVLFFWLLGGACSRGPTAVVTGFSPRPGLGCYLDGLGKDTSVDGGALGSLSIGVCFGRSEKKTISLILKMEVGQNLSLVVFLDDYHPTVIYFTSFLGVGYWGFDPWPCIFASCTLLF